jgi:hypothetical protein
MRAPAASADKQNIITPTAGIGSKSAIEKFLMMYTCKLCSGRNAQMVTLWLVLTRTTRLTTKHLLLQISKVAYYKGMVVSTCRQCKQYHLIADNERKLDMGGDYGTRVDEFLSSRGEAVQRLSVSLQELEDNYLVDKDGVLTMVPKSTAQV